MILCYLGLGSNLKGPERQLRQAIAALRRLPRSRLVKVAGFHKSKAWGRKAQPDYCNTVVALYTSLAPCQLLDYCQQIEHRQGRIRKLKWGARTIDIDILLFGNQNINLIDLKVPHPRLNQRNFVLIPLLEIAPNLQQENIVAYK
ncbi:2-amino-4-hydroxy-6-hydroxymethyldihydropteridine diphosphokinase [Legionella fairfieldensis]|uniref:2-amino-4-hydroxy-6- hydroxymethyldihydropteridine diphosphokinase n=1 Tax=Legionella fairfieldensis TaxID=45064 RepID=UPI00048F7AA0|nr:2-amino-4-hydroxy-6-hydroxymethyldihydropteridine diphosphokinase [Legionella fairfieldensis]